MSVLSTLIVFTARQQAALSGNMLGAMTEMEVTMASGDMKDVSISYLNYHQGLKALWLTSPLYVLCIYIPNHHLLPKGLIFLNTAKKFENTQSMEDAINYQWLNYRWVDLGQPDSCAYLKDYHYCQVNIWSAYYR